MSAFSLLKFSMMSVLDADKKFFFIRKDLHSNENIFDAPATKTELFFFFLSGTMIKFLPLDILGVSHRIP